MLPGKFILSNVLVSFIGIAFITIGVILGGGSAVLYDWLIG